MLKKYSHILFDLDGTIYNTEYAYTMALFDVVKRIDPNTHETYESLTRFMGSSAKDTNKELHYSEDEFEKLSEEWADNVKKYADKINEYNDSDDIWTTVLYYVSNESKTLSSLDPNIKQMSDTYGIDIEMKGLNELVDMTSLHPRNIDASLVLNRDAVMSFTETSLASARSYIVRLPLTELIRITCDNATLRNEYNLEDENVLYKTNVDIRVLFDNVRGFILKSKYKFFICKVLNCL